MKIRACILASAAVAAARLRQVLRQPRHLLVLLVFPVLMAWGMGAILPAQTEGVGPSPTGSGGAYGLYLPSAAALALVLSAFHGSATLLARDRREGMLLRLTATPAPSWVPSLGLICAAALLGWLQVGLLIGVGRLFLGLPWPASPVGTILLIALASMSLAGAGLTLGALGRTPEEVGSLASVVGVSLLGVGGAFVPSFLFPSWLRLVARSTPIHPLVAGLRAQLGGGAPSLLHPLALALWTVILLIAAAMSSRRTLQPH